MTFTLGTYADLFKLEACLFTFRGWLSNNFLIISAEKTDFMAVRPSKLHYLFQNLRLKSDYLNIKCREKVKNLDMVFDPMLSFESNLKEVTKTAFYHLRNFAKMMNFHLKMQKFSSMHSCHASTTAMFFSLGFQRKVLEACRWFKTQLLAF